MQQVEILARAGNSYDEPGSSLKVNQGTLDFDTDFGPVKVQVNIKDYKLGGEPVHGAYFERRKNMNFSIVFTFTPNKDISGDSLVWGNDFDTPIRDLLPWGFSAAFAAFKRLIDPSVEGDVYADEPYLYGPCLTSINYIYDGTQDKMEESAESDAEAKARQRKYLDPSLRKEYIFKAGQSYTFEFCTPFLELSTQLAVKLPGFTFDVGKYAGKTELRFVLRANDELVFKVTFDVPGAADASTAPAAADSTEPPTGDPNDMDQVD